MIAMAYITMVFETNATMNHVNKHKSADWPNELAGKLLKELTKWTQPSDLVAILEMRAELSKVRMKRK